MGLATMGFPAGLFCVHFQPNFILAQPILPYAVANAGDLDRLQSPIVLDQPPDPSGDALLRRQVPLRILSLGAEAMIQAQPPADRNEVEPLVWGNVFHCIWPPCR
jgi:hypothetical protein